MGHADRARRGGVGGTVARGAAGGTVARCLAAALVLAAALAPAAVRAQSATLAMTADRAQVAVGEQLRVQVRLDVTGAEAPEPQLPDLSEFDVLSRQVSRPMQFRFGFGSQTQVVQSTAVYTFLLRARQPGRFELAPARANVAGREFVSNPLTIVVGGGNAPGALVPPGQGLPGQARVPQPPQQGAVPPPAAQPPSGPLDGAIYDDQAFLRTVVDRSDPWLGQQVTVTIYLYVRGALRGSPVITREPTTDGLWVHDLLPPSRTLEPTTQVVGSTPFRVYVLRRFAAFPLRAGDLTIGATSAQIPIGNVFDIFAGGASPDLDRTGVALTLSVRDLPQAARPQGEVHVGQITLEASLDRNQVPTGDAVTLTVRATGTGYVQGIRLDDPRVDGLRVLTPQTHDQISAPGDLVGGTRTFEWLIVPEREGTHGIPAFRVATFDPVSGRYGVAESPTIELTAAGNPVGAAAEADEADEPSPEDAPGEAQLGPLRTESALSRSAEGLADRAWFPWLLALFPLAWLGVVIATAARRRAAARAGVSTPQKAAREARRRLAVAEELATKGEAREFYAAISLALRSVVEGRIGEAVGSLTHKQLERRLVERGMSGELARRVAEELEGHEMVRFSASGAQPAEMQATLGRARDLIGELDRFTAKPAEDA